MGEGLTRTIYVVDDDPSVRKSLARLLRSAGLRSRSFDDALHFLSEADHLHDGCLILDLTMPTMSGNELQARLREASIDIPVIVVSARDDEESRRTARELGARFFFHKPVDGQALLDAIAWVDQPVVAEQGHGGRGAGP